MGMRVFLLLCVVIAVTGCRASGVDRNVSEAMDKYLGAKRSIYAHPDADTLSVVATTNEVQNLFPVVQALRATDNIMKTEMEYSIERTQFDSSGVTATVQTRECWKYWWEDRTTGKVTQDRRVENYCLEYSLIKGDCGAWKVDRVQRIDQL